MMRKQQELKDNNHKISLQSSQISIKNEIITLDQLIQDLKNNHQIELKKKDAEFALKSKTLRKEIEELKNIQ